MFQINKYFNRKRIATFAKECSHYLPTLLSIYMTQNCRFSIKYIFIILGEYLTYVYYLQSESRFKGLVEHLHWHFSDYGITDLVLGQNVKSGGIKGT